MNLAELIGERCRSVVDWNITGRYEVYGLNDLADLETLLDMPVRRQMQQLSDAILLLHWSLVSSREARKAVRVAFN